MRRIGTPRIRVNTTIRSNNPEVAGQLVAGAVGLRGRPHDTERTMSGAARTDFPTSFEDAGRPERRSARKSAKLTCAESPYDASTVSNKTRSDDWFRSSVIHSTPQSIVRGQSGREPGGSDRALIVISSSAPWGWKYLRRLRRVGARSGAASAQTGGCVSVDPDSSTVPVSPHSSLTTEGHPLSTGDRGMLSASTNVNCGT
jgi:hypothetical protein